MSRACRDCGAPLLMVRKAEARRWTPLDAEPVTPGNVDAREVRAVDGLVGWKIPHLREQLEFARLHSTGRNDPGDVSDYPWHRVHRCEVAR